MANYNTDYLKFDAISIKNSIIQHLSNNTNFTAQIYEGSNLTALIDTFSHLFEVLMYYINTGSSEAIFEDARLYENVNRIVKMLGYNPLGGLSSKTTVSFENVESVSGTIFDDDSAQKEIPKYSKIDTGKTDSNGNPIYYSSISRLFVSDVNPASDVNTFTAVNGEWRAYERTFRSNGEPFEEYVLDAIPLDVEDNPHYVAHPYIDVYVKTTDPDTGEALFDQYDAITVGTIFGTPDTILGPDTKKFELRINEDKEYVVKFGDGIHGKRLSQGDEIYVIYLEGNGSEGTIGIETINAPGVVSWGIAGLDETTFLALLGLEPSDVSFLVSDTEMDNLLFKNITASTTYTQTENVESIKTNAPHWFKSGGNLITKTDYEQFILAYHSSDVYDVLVMNNWDYLSKFYKWLDTYGALKIDIRNHGYEYVDSCDFNNVYIWLKYKYTELNEVLVQEEMQGLKTLTAEPKLQTALDSKLIPCLTFDTDPTIATGYDNLRYSITDWDPDIENWIEIIKDKNTFMSAEKIRSQVISTIKDFFAPTKNLIGGELNINTLYDLLQSISGVQQVRTAFKATSDPNSATQYLNSLSFAKWTPIIISGKDVEIVKGTVKLEDFQFPVLVESDLSSRIKIVAESFGQPSIEY
jgi:hypothetical protein